MAASNAVAQGLRNRNMLVFLVVWFGQTISLVGSGLTNFALGVWMYQQTGSVTLFGIISMFTMLPTIIFSPFAGALVDRWDRRKALILSDVGAGVCTLAIALLLWVGRLDFWMICLLTGLSSTVGAFRWPAYYASMSLLVPKEQLGRAGGLAQLGQALAQIVAPLMAGVLITVIALEQIILLDFVSFVIAITTILAVRLPRPEATEEGKASKGSIFKEAAYGWTYIKARPGLLGLLMIFAAVNFSVAFLQTLVTPLVLSIASTTVLGTVLAIGGIGTLAGGIVMSIWGGPKRHVLAILAFLFSQGVALMLSGVWTGVVMLSVTAFVFFFSIPIFNGNAQAIWMRKVATDLQGRVFAVRMAAAWSSIPIAFLIAGPLVDRVFEPLLAPGGGLAGSVGRIIGVGPGRGIGLMFVLLGIMLMSVAVTAYLSARVLHVEEELPDAIPDTAGKTADSQQEEVEALLRAEAVGEVRSEGSA